MKRPWMKFYPADWRADPRLRMCSLAARGLWIDLISYMHEGEPYGHLNIDGVVPDLQGIASLVARPVAEVRKALDELQAKRVFSRTEAGAIYSRRMVRDAERSDEGRKQIEKRWGSSQNPNSPPNRSESQEPITQMLDTRNQKSESSLSAQGAERESEAKFGGGKVVPLPVGWSPSESDMDDARELGLSAAEIAQEIQTFMNHARDKKRRSADWRAAFSNWCIKSAKRLGRMPAKGRSTISDRPSVFVREGTQEWDEWQDHLRATTGKGSPCKNGGWHFASERPPAAAPRAQVH